jgi:hypothetical protein
MDLPPPFDQMSWESYESTSGGRRRDLGDEPDRVWRRLGL